MNEHTVYFFLDYNEIYGRKLFYFSSILRIYILSFNEKIIYFVSSLGDIFDIILTVASKPDVKFNMTQNSGATSHSCILN